MQRGQATELFRSPGGQPKANAAVIVAVALPADETGDLRPVYQAAGAVVTQKQLLRDVSDRRAIQIGEPSDGQEELVLSG
jgi:hypothetical protein